MSEKINKYAQINFCTLQMIGEYQSIPTRWTTPGGATINNFNKLNQAALYGLGWVPVKWEAITNTETHKYAAAPVYDEENKQFVYQAVARAINVLKSESCTAIDNAAGDASARYISVGIGQEMRYMQKLTQAEEYLAAIDSGEIPDINDYPILRAEADAVKNAGNYIEFIYGFAGTQEEIKTDYAAYAKTIADIAAEWTTVATSIEAVRISGKYAVNTAESNDNVITIRDDVIKKLEAV